VCVSSQDDPQERSMLLRKNALRFPLAVRFVNFERVGSAFEHAERDFGSRRGWGREMAEQSTRRRLFEGGRRPSLRECHSRIHLSKQRYNCRSLPREASFLPVLRSRRAVPCANLSVPRINRKANWSAVNRQFIGIEFIDRIRRVRGTRTALMTSRQKCTDGQVNK